MANLLKKVGDNYVAMFSQLREGIYDANLFPNTDGVAVFDSGKGVIATIGVTNIPGYRITDTITSDDGKTCTRWKQNHDNPGKLIGTEYIPVSNKL